MTPDGGFGAARHTSQRWNPGGRSRRTGPWVDHQQKHWIDQQKTWNWREKGNVWFNEHWFTMIYIDLQWFTMIYNDLHLVGGIPTPLKNMSSSVGVTMPDIWKVIKHVTKPPARHWFLFSQGRCRSRMGMERTEMRVSKEKHGYWTSKHGGIWWICATNNGHMPCQERIVQDAGENATLVAINSVVKADAESIS